MKQIIYLILAGLTLFNCTGYLDEESKTTLTVDALYSTAEGIEKAVTGLYVIEQRGPRDGAWWDGAEMLSIIGGTDITLMNGGPANGYRTYDPIEMQNGEGVATNIWKYHYTVIAKANEIIYYGEQLLPEHAELARPIAEAKYFRAHSYFWLFRKYDRIWLNTEPTTPENVNDPRDYRPAAPEDVYALVTNDLDYAIENLQDGVRDPGRVTVALARHIRADVAMWQGNWAEAIKQAEAIFADQSYALVPLERLFGSAELNHSESL
jgi:hypothetical protein